MTAVFEGKVALVTGGASGIGRVTALAFARHGAQIVIADINVNGGRQTAALAEEFGANAHFIATDVAQAPDVENLMLETIRTFGHLDCAFNNAGVAVENAPAMKLTVDYGEEDWNRIMSVNLKGVWLCMKYELLQMHNQRHGSIVNAASVLGMLGYPGLSIYSASKHGVIGLTQAAAREYILHGIRVNAVCPGYIRSPMVEKLIDFNSELSPSIYGNPEEVAKTVLWLCSEESSFVNGQAIVLDGGMTAF